MRTLLLAATAAFALALPASAQEERKGALAPSEIVAAAPAADWVAIAAEDLLVMTLGPDADGSPRQVVIQLMPAPFSQGWVHNIRLFARAGWYDGISVNRVQDNYVTQWGDPNYDNPEATGEAKPLPEGLKVMNEEEYAQDGEALFRAKVKMYRPILDTESELIDSIEHALDGIQIDPRITISRVSASVMGDHYADFAGFISGIPVAAAIKGKGTIWPIHCYGMVGVGRNYSPDTGSGAELYTVIGHAPRHLDRNIALVGRVIEGMQHLSSLPRGSGALGFYTAEEAAKRTPILTVRVASDLPAAEQPSFEYLSTESATFATYAEAIANRRDPFFIVPAGGADICNIRVPVRRVAE
ncbi:MAG: peptidylprolyl isomerase [Erythrobacter sp.]|nr:peptidylprolyl isomerase [Erythrobacter sp.]MDZ4272131.1 peptidylprolyl isomerase [Erythrobacter sp.]